MEGVTDAPMRALMGETGAFTFAVSEFLRVSHEVPPLHVFHRHVPELKNGSRTPNGLPVAVQLLGGNPERLAATARMVAEAGAYAVDLNFGCPAKTVNRHDGGATLLKYPDRIFTIVKAVRDAVPASIPVSAKLRLGWDDPTAIHRNAEQAERAGASWITIHGRTKEQGYRPPAYWAPIGEVRRNLSIPVVANGDIWTREDFLRCREESGCQHFMLGRGALANPALPGLVARELGINLPKEVPALGTYESWQPWIERFAHWSEGYPIPSSEYLPRRLKQWLKMAHLRGEISWFDTVKRFETYEQFQSARV